MRPIIEYQNYRRYIQDYYTERKKTSGFTWRQFAALAEFASGSYLKLVCDGKTRLTKKGAEQTAKAMKLVGFKFRYFVLMVEYDNAKVPAEKEVLFQEMLALAMEHRVQVVAGKDVKYFNSWLNPVVRELVCAMPGATAKEIAAQCMDRASADDVENSIQYLEKNGLIAKDESGRYHQTRKSLSTGPLEAVPDEVRNMHRQMGQWALQSLDDLPMEERHFSGLTLGIPKSVYEKVEEELARCRRRIIAIATESDKTEQVYRLNLQFFPLTKLLPSAGED